MFVSASGVVGIGTTNPSAKLEVSGGDNTLKVTGTAPSSAYAAFIISQINSGFGIYDQATKHYFAGNVGIGTNDSTVKLTVNGSVSANGNLTMQYIDCGYIQGLFGSNNVTYIKNGSTHTKNAKDALIDLFDNL
jgi:hypothetical protein